MIDLDVQAFFDSLDHELVLRAVAKHTNVPWIMLYVRRWLKAPLQMADGTVATRDRGTPQGSAISPLLANLFLHPVDHSQVRGSERQPVEAHDTIAARARKSQAAAP